MTLFERLSYIVGRILVALIFLLSRVRRQPAW